MLTRRLPLPANVRLFGHRKAETFVHESAKAALHGRSYRDRDPGENLAASYPAPVPGYFNIGVLHTALTGGRPPHAPYSPCTPDELTAKGYRYWALGHVHEYEVVATEPHIVFCGALQGRNIRECGPKGAVLVSVEDGEVTGLRHLQLDAVRWVRVEVDTSLADADVDMQSAVRAALKTTFDSADSRLPLMARVVLVGQTKHHGSLLQRQITICEEVRAIAVGISDIFWIEKVMVATTPPPIAGTGAGSLSDDIAALLEVGISDADLKAELGVDFTDFTNRIPSDLGDEASPLIALRRGELDHVLQEAAASLRARLLGEVG